MVKENEETVIDLGRLLLTLKKNLFSIIAWAVVGLIISLVVLFIFIEPKYSATTDILVNQKNDNVQTQYAAQQADLGAVTTYEDILKRSVILSPVLKEVRARDNYKGSLGDLQKSVSVSNETNSKIISVTVTDKDAYTAADIANTVAKTFKEKIVKMMKIDNVTIVSTAKPNATPVFPKKTLGALVGIVLGALIGIAIAIVRELTDKTVKDMDFLTDEVGLTSLGTVFHIEDDDAFAAVEVLNENREATRTKRV
ncbi:Wzz/FepE/Etk N-terminal domain-containing protein [Ligilactobacillus agilis]|uniref:Capsular polysaccharide biosynthesis protein CpsC n=1 Tax=Ligilactobacillus agilis TaxID=1601 RepID=A0A222W427_9LACO|nr:Wzz/FepE/Etk N-terminal domain-containing protein [Ligilactobacillus agilis]ASR40914.1 chain-length determining protein [Ligilactobacillus agilis]NJE31514.1 chain-length determining protein [Ligilactobacillus agilis]UXC62745.1 Wzz/FepE/Etk N-terminal domain-containing protein [Ligilactobacillus agilis]UXC64744.1 Wzz/FepE/Etk N-terminal domain-containing protein [Ligilactobacillus agilis]GET17774.1 exopolysaccharide biosynthesis protein [Ligilactobacillus agilis]